MEPADLSQFGVSRGKYPRENLTEYIQTVYGLGGEYVHQLALEDLYTPIHQAISKRESIKGYLTDALRDVERDLNSLVAKAINDICVNDDEDNPRHIDVEYLHQFAKQLVCQKRESPTSDRFCIISLNWDIHLDGFLFHMIRSAGAKNSEGWMDYGCHCTAYEGGRFLPPPILAKERKSYTIKNLKLHGSFNWRFCPQCDKLYVHTDVSNGVSAFKDVLECPQCGLLGMEYSLLLPTFRKDLSRFHFQHIWNQAAIELSEATRIVFIGYSFPLADFDFRSLITKHLGDVSVDVVLYNDRPPFQNKPGWKRPKRGSEDDPNTEYGNRYLDYFGNKIDHIYYEGVQYWIANHMKDVLK